MTTFIGILISLIFTVLYFYITAEDKEIDDAKTGLGVFIKNFTDLFNQGDSNDPNES